MVIFHCHVSFFWGYKFAWLPRVPRFNAVNVILENSQWAMQRENHHPGLLVGGCTNPFEQIFSGNWIISPKNWGEHPKKNMEEKKSPPRMGFFMVIYPMVQIQVLSTRQDRGNGMVSFSNSVDGWNPKANHRLDVKKPVVNNGISTTNLNWWSPDFSHQQ